jgi:lysozyme family protein
LPQVVSRCNDGEVTARFDLAILATLEHEGGECFTNHPADKGGATKWGITAKTLGEWRKLGHPASADEVKALDRPEAEAIYRARYWDACRCDEIDDQLVAAKVFDLAVNCGPPAAIRMLQKAANRCQPVVLETDGVMGPRTLAAVFACESGELVIELVHVATEFYLAIVNRDPSQRVFLAGWLKRARWPYDTPGVA